MIYNTIIIGAGPAAYSAALYCARFKLKTLLVGLSSNSTMQEAQLVENWPGIKSIEGSKLLANLKDHAASYNITIKEEEVIDIEKNKDIFTLKTNKSTYQSKALIFATGSSRRKLTIPGAKEFEKKGVSYCAACDAPLFKDKIVAVIGGSDSAVKEAVLLAKYARKVYIIYRKDKLRAEPVNVAKLKKNKKLEIIYNTNLTEIKGNKFVTSVLLDKKYKNKSELLLDGIFIEIGSVPGSALAAKLGVLINDKQEIITDKYSRTNIPSIFAAGDVTDNQLKQIIIASSQGVMAAFGVYNYLKK